MTTVGELLAMARALGIERLDAQLLLCHVLSCDRTWLVANDQHVLPKSRLDAATDLLQRRAVGEPFAYLVGEKEFHGLTLRVTPAVLIPRPDTETLVDWALELAPRWNRPRVLDMGTGSGAIALAIQHRCPAARVTALDASAEALAVASDNARRLGLSVEFVLSQWWDSVTPASFDVVVSNPPYIRAGDPHLADLQHEPQLALTSGPEGLESLREIVNGAAWHLRAGSWLLLEHGYDQAAAVRHLFESAPGQAFTQVETRTDLAGRERCTGACRS